MISYSLDLKKPFLAKPLTLKKKGRLRGAPFKTYGEEGGG